MINCFFFNSNQPKSSASTSVEPESSATAVVESTENISSLIEDVHIRKNLHAIDIFNLIKKKNMENLVPNMVIAYRIMLSTPVSVASGERSFSELKIIKNYLRNAMNQERLNSLGIISIESDVAKSINYNDIIEDFASSKARKRKLN